MNSLERRIERAERFAGVKEESRPVIVVRLEYGSDDTLPHFPEPVEQWVTWKRAMADAEQASLPCIFIANPWSEYEAQHGLEPGTLAKHELCGKVPFAELLTAATGRTPDRGEEPCTN